jgi:hypothetical protein
MKIARLTLIALCACVPLAALADRDKHEGGHGKHGKHRAEFKEEYWDGNCKVERKLKKNGDYKEERKCKAAQPAAVYVPAPVYVAPAPVYVAPTPVIVEPGITINGTVRLR